MNSKVWKMMESITLVVILIIAFIMGTQEYTKNVDNARFYQRHLFIPAVMFASGKGFINTRTKIPELEEFLEQKTDTFDSSMLPHKVQNEKLSAFQGITRYLVYYVGIYWKFFGISWSGIGPLFGLLFAFAILACYGLFRVAMHPLLAIIGTLCIMFSLNHLEFLPHLRDYGKTPFIFSGMFIMSYVVARKLAPKKLLLWTFLGAFVLGVGTGFRSDILICIPPFVIALLFFVPKDVSIKIRITAVSLFLLVYSIISAPVFSTINKGSNGWHVFLLGFSKSFTSGLNIKPSMYQSVQFYNDGEINSLVNDYHWRNYTHKHLFLASKAYDKAGAQCFFAIARTFPADVFTRAYASILQILRLPFTTPRNRYYKKYTMGIYMVITALVILSWLNLRLAIFALLFLLYFGGYPSLQFGLRHIFHLEFIAMWATGFVIYAALLGIWELLRLKFTQFPKTIATETIAKWRENPKWVGKNFAVFALICAFLILLPVYSLRLYQTFHLQNLFKSYQQAEKEIISTKTTFKDSETTIITPIRNQKWDFSKQAFHTEYIVAKFRAADAKKVLLLPVTIRYQAEKNFSDYSRTFQVKLSTRHPYVYVYFRTYNYPNSFFKSLEISKGKEHHLEALYKVKDLSQFELLLDLILPHDWDSKRLYQKLR